MLAYATQRQAQRRRGRRPTALYLTPERATWRSQMEELRTQRRRDRLAAKASDAAWHTRRQAHHQQQATWQALSPAEKRRCHAQRATEEAQWRAERQARRTEMACRQEATCTWHQARRALCVQQAQWQPAAEPVSAWIAILVVIDNCTRRCLGLPMFEAGLHVKAELVVEALSQLLPVNLQFVISDNGSQFRSDAFAALAKAAGFVSVRIAPYRARTNGIAERFVRTLKEGLQDKSWSAPDELPVLLTQLNAVYNDRPHQGRDLCGLSPNEYACRLWSSATC